MQDVCEELCACRKELQTQTTGLKRASHDREELAKDRAALHARLKSADRKACGIAQEMVALRSVCLPLCVYVCGLTSKMCVTLFRLKPVFPVCFLLLPQHKLQENSSVFVG